MNTRITASEEDKNLINPFRNEFPTFMSFYQTTVKLNVHIWTIQYRIIFNDLASLAIIALMNSFNNACPIYP